MARSRMERSMPDRAQSSAYAYRVGSPPACGDRGCIYYIIYISTIFTE